MVSVEPPAPLQLAPDPFAPAPLSDAPSNPAAARSRVERVGRVADRRAHRRHHDRPATSGAAGGDGVLYPHSNLAAVAQKPILLLVSQFLIYGVVAAGMIMLVEGKYHVAFWPAMKWNWPRSGQWKLLGLGAVMLIGLGALQSMLPMPKDTPFEHLFDRPRDAYLLAIIAVSLGPLMEELFFRGFMYPVLARRMGVVWGVVLTALPFGLIHLPQYGWAWGAALVIVLVGVVCGVVRAKTGSVGASFLVHAGYNGTQMIIALVLTHGFQHMPKAALIKVLIVWPRALLPAESNHEPQSLFHFGTDQENC